MNGVLRIGIETKGTRSAVSVDPIPARNPPGVLRPLQESYRHGRRITDSLVARARSRGVVHHSQRRRRGCPYVSC